MLLDTQILIWLTEDPARIPDLTKTQILNAPILYLSTASVWEMAIKIDKLHIKQPLNDFISNFIQDYQCQLLDINLSHILHTQQLELHHRDPFDRLIISQSIIEGIPIVSSDAMFDTYHIQRIW